MAELRVVVAGAGGRMGRTLIRAVLGQSRMRLVGALDRPERTRRARMPALLAGVGASGIAVTADPLPAFANTDVRARFHRARRRRSPMPSSPRRRASSTSSARPGSTAEHEERLKAAARHCRIVRSGNMSLGVNLLAGLVRRAAAMLGADYDIEIVEMHHRHKVDAPVGHGAAARPRRGARGAASTLGENSVRVARRPHRRAAARRDRLREPARRLGRRRPYGDLGRRGRADRAHAPRRKPRQLCPRRDPRRALGLRQEARPLRHGRRARRSH